MQPPIGRRWTLGPRALALSAAVSAAWAISPAAEGRQPDHGEAPALLDDPLGHLRRKIEGFMDESRLMALRLPPERLVRLERFVDEAMIDSARARVLAAGWNEVAAALPKGVAREEAAKVLDRAMADPANAASLADEILQVFRADAQWRHQRLVERVAAGGEAAAADMAALLSDPFLEPDEVWTRTIPTAEELGHTRAFLARLREAGMIELIDRVAAAPYCVLLPTRAGGEWQHSLPGDALPAARKLARLCRLGLMLAAADGDAAALAQWSRRFAASRRLASASHSKIGFLVESAVDSLWCSTLMQSITQGDLTGDRAEAALAALEASGPLDLRAALVGEAWFMRSAIADERLRQADPNRAEEWLRVQKTVDGWLPLIDGLRPKPAADGAPPVPEPALAEALRVLADMPDWQELARLRGDAERSLRSMDVDSVRWRGEASRAAARVVLLLERHRTTHGEYPPSLAALHPAARAALPANPAAGPQPDAAESWAYRRLETPDPDGRLYILTAGGKDARALNPGPLRRANARGPT